MKPMILKLLLLNSLFLISGCASSPTMSATEARVAPTGPTVMNARSTPGTIDLDKNLQSKQIPQILADVKDYTSSVNQVVLRFIDVPLEIQMQNLQGTTWEASLTPEQLKKLAVSGKSIKYEANVIATDEEGRSATSPEPVKITIKTPELARTTG